MFYNHGAILRRKGNDSLGVNVHSKLHLSFAAFNHGIATIIVFFLKCAETFNKFTAQKNPSNFKTADEPRVGGVFEECKGSRYDEYMEERCGGE